VTATEVWCWGGKSEGLGDGNTPAGFRGKFSIGGLRDFVPPVAAVFCKYTHKFS
jgi:hypothetical protein